MAATAGNSVEKKTKMVTLISSDGEKFDVTEAAAAMSQVLANMIEDHCVEDGIRLPNVDSKTLVKIIEYCNKHAAVLETAGDIAATSHAADLKSFDENFIKVDNSTLFNIILAADYMAILGLLDLTCKAVADQLRGKSVEEMRKTFNIVNDFMPEEEEAIRKENSWAFD